MQTIRVVLLVLVGLAALVAANPTVFLGGDFQSLAGTGVWNVEGPSQLAAYHRATGHWSTKPQGAYVFGSSAIINDIAAAGNGVFAVGQFDGVSATGSPVSQGVAYWDGDKWCTIRESIAGVGHAVHCDTSTSCWVTGVFTDINNLPDGIGGTTNFAHYNFDETANEWEFDQAITEWNTALAGITPMPITPAIDRLYAVGSFFFVSDDSNNIYKGGAADDGWALFANAASIDATPSPIRDWTVEGSAVYVITEAPTDNSAGKPAAVITGTKVTNGCGGPCTATVPADWNTLIGNNNASVFQGYYKIAVTGTTQYLVTLHDIDAGESDWSAKYRVVSHSGNGGATLNFVGEPFQLGGSNPIVQMWTDENGNVVVVGPQYGNLFYPPNTDDNSGALADRRITDRFTEIAVYNGSRWMQAFGGGFEPSSNFATELRHAYNSATGEFFFVGPFTATYDVHAEGAAFFDDDDDLETPFFPLFSRAITRRGSFPSLAAVYDIVCDTSSCANVFVGGNFAHHGPDSFGAVAAVAADRSGNPEVTPVGGGLWIVDTTTPEQDNIQTTAGYVYALARWGNDLYAGGLFRHGSRPTNPDYVCLHNIARIDVTEENAVWEDLHAGCDAPVYDIVFWNDLLIAGGDFIQCGGGRVVNYVASYSFQSGDNAQWASLHNGVDNTVFSLEVFQGRLIAGGGFTHAGGLPVTGVASWDGWKWRALLPACTDDCVASGLGFYYTNLQVPGSVYDLKKDLSGESLWARIVIPSGPEVLGKWQYTSGDLGQWTVAGDSVVLDNHPERRGHTIANFGQDNIILAAPVGPSSWRSVAGEVGLYHSGIDNWVADQRSVVGQSVYVIRGPEAGSASTLASPLSVLLSFF